MSRNWGWSSNPAFSCSTSRSALPPAEGKASIFTTRQGKEVASAAKGQKGTGTFTDVWNRGEIKAADEWRQWIQGAGSGRFREWKWRQKSDSWSTQLTSLTIIQDDAMCIVLWYDFFNYSHFGLLKVFLPLRPINFVSSSLEHLIYNIQATYSRTPFSLSCFILGCNLFWRQRSLSRVECSLNLWSAVTRVGTCAGFIIHLLAKFR